jgi:hypothetical protein
MITPENDSNEILTQIIGLTCSGQTGRIHRADFDVLGACGGTVVDLEPAGREVGIAQSG